MGDYVDVQIDGAVARELHKFTKSELVEKLVIASLKAKVEKGKADTLEKKLDIAESYIEQGRAMVDAVMERWHEYDV